MNYLDNNSLGGDAMGVDKKPFAHHMGDKSGIGFILKTAGIKNDAENINKSKSVLNSNEKENRMNSLHSYTTSTSRIQDNQIIQSNQLKINQNLNKIKGRNLFNNKSFKKSISTEIFCFNAC